MDDSSDCKQTLISDYFLTHSEIRLVYFRVRVISMSHHLFFYIYLFLQIRSNWSICLLFPFIFSSKLLLESIMGNIFLVCLNLSPNSLVYRYTILVYSLTTANTAVGSEDHIFQQLGGTSRLAGWCVPGSVSRILVFRALLHSTKRARKLVEFL